jgi:membrane-associated phospholipid phosphatase
VVLPGVAAVLLFLLWSRWARGAVAWAVSMGGVMATMLVLKVLVSSVGRGWSGIGLNSPSGHTAAAAAFYGGLAVILGPPMTTLAAGLIATAIAVVFAATRLLLGYHTPFDVLIGGVVGVAGLLIFCRTSGPVPRALPRDRLVILLLLVGLAFHGHRLPAEGYLHRLAVTRVRPVLQFLEGRAGRIF